MTVSSIEKTPKKSILELLPGSFPHAQIPEKADVEAAARSVLDAFPNYGASDFADDAIWRDSYGLTGTFRTFYYGQSVGEEWGLLHKRRGVSPATLVKGSSKRVIIDDNSMWLECRFTFSTSNPSTECSGFLSLVPTAEGKWKIWLLRTVLEELSGQPSVDSLEPCVKPQPANDAVNGSVESHASRSINGTTNGLANGAANGTTNGAANGFNGTQPQTSFLAVVIGGGQGGLSVGGRLQALGVSYVVLEKNKHVGDAWRMRYESAKLHTIREYAHLPFDRTFGPEYGEYLGKEELAQGHRNWAKKYGINIWLSTSLESGTWDADRQLYTLQIVKHGVPLQITARHVVFATGAGSQTPIMPNLADRDKFHGVVMHSAEYTSAKDWKGKSGIVIGTANTGHDVADDMYEAGMQQVTMVQRNRTYVLPLEYIEDRYKGKLTKAEHPILYNDKTPTEFSDRIMFTNPVSIARAISAKAFHAMARAQPERWDALERAGFKVDPYGDIQDAINVRLGGHYIDVGTSAKISKGLIKIKSDAAAVAYTENGLAFSDGTEIKADVIVFATGFLGNLRQHVERLLGKDVADRAGDCFGLNEEGEILGAFKPVKQPGLWYLGGALGHARYYSRYIALSIKAHELGTPIPVYTDHQFTLEDIKKTQP